jgi:hypothetical protein
MDPSMDRTEFRHFHGAQNGGPEHLETPTAGSLNKAKIELTPQKIMLVALFLGASKLRVPGQQMAKTFGLHRHCHSTTRPTA